MSQPEADTVGLYQILREIHGRGVSEFLTGKKPKKVYYESDNVLQLKWMDALGRACLKNTI